MFKFDITKRLHKCKKTKKLPPIISLERCPRHFHGISQHISTIIESLRSMLKSQQKHKIYPIQIKSNDNTQRTSLIYKEEITKLKNKTRTRLC